MANSDEQSQRGTETLYFDDLAVGEAFSFGSRTVDQQAIIDFAEQFDPQYFHLDAAAAEDSLFDGLVASGWHTVSVCNRMLIDDVFSDIAIMGGSGTDGLRWPNPVRPGDTLKGTVTIDEKRDSGYEESGYVEMTINATNQRDEPVLTMSNSIIIQRQDS